MHTDWVESRFRPIYLTVRTFFDSGAIWITNKEDNNIIGAQADLLHINDGNIIEKITVCDIQENFRPVIWEFDSVISTTKKMLRAASILSIPVYATTQNRNRLGETCSELCLENAVENTDKMAFSMWTPAIRQHFGKETQAEIAIVGIESHICITQTTLDLLASGHKVYILADGISSRNREEIPVALKRLQKEGAVITTSESFLFECMGDAGIPEFKNMAKLIKESEEDSKRAVKSLLGKL